VQGTELHLSLLSNLGRWLVGFANPLAALNRALRVPLLALSFREC
jgi:hypothetical protein